MGKASPFAAQAAYLTPTGVFTGTIGYNGTILGTGAAVTAIGVAIPFTGERRRTVGFPMTTGKLSISVTNVDGTLPSEMFVRTWLTLEIPEPRTSLSAAAGLLVLFGCHGLARRPR